jgi:alpha-L-fucosidase
MRRPPTPLISVLMALPAALSITVTGLAIPPVPAPVPVLASTTSVTTSATTWHADVDADATDCTAPIRPASVLPVVPCDDPGRVVDKAAHIVPRPANLAWQRKEVTAFTHFGMNTFTDREWGSGAEDEATFDPARVNVEQWMRAYKAAGAKQAMFTIKHHDGFVLYPTRYSDHSVIASPWWVRTEGCAAASEVAAARARAAAARATDASAYWQVRAAGCENPQGDLLGTYVRAARAAGLKVGVYISPADGAELPHAFHQDYVRQIVAKHDAGQPLTIEEQATYDDRDRAPAGLGRYGNGGPVTERTIPTLVNGDDRARDVAAGRLPSFKVTTDDYNAYYLNQLYELLTQYGPFDELWLDGANPWSSAGITETYDYPAWFRLLRSLAPDTVVFGGPQGARWVGNEDGVARETEWSVTPATADPSTFHNEFLLPEGAQAADIGSRDKLTAPSVRYLQWFPAEADVSLRPGWFYHADQRPKSPAQLVQRYESSVGRNAVLLLNVPPGPDGRIADADLAALTAFGASIRRTYGRNLATRTGEFTVRSRAAFDRIRLGEDITRGQQVERFTVDAWTEPGTATGPGAAAGARAGWRQIAAGTTIGYSRILALPAPVTADRVRVRIQQSRGTPHLAFLGLYRT